MKQTIEQRYRELRGKHPHYRAGECYRMAKCDAKREALLCGQDIDLSLSYDSATIQLPADDSPESLAAIAGECAEGYTPKYVAVVTCEQDDDTSFELDGVGEYTDTPTYAPKGHRLLSFDRDHAGRGRDRNSYRYFTPDCNPWEEAKYWHGCKHDRFNKAIQCTLGQFELAEAINNGEAWSAGYRVDVFLASDCTFDPMTESWDTTEADPIAEYSCWGFVQGLDNDTTEADVWDVIVQGWHAAQDVVRKAEKDAREELRNADEALDRWGIPTVGRVPA